MLHMTKPVKRSIVFQVIGLARYGDSHAAPSAIVKNQIKLALMAPRAKYIRSSIGY